MKKSHKGHDHEEHVDESWLVPYADILTLLLALFIVLFASSQLDQKKLDQLASSFNSAFTGGSGFFEPSTTLPVGEPGYNIESGTSDTKWEGEGGKELQDAAQKEQYEKETQELEQLKEELNQYITDNGLSAVLSTELNGEQLAVKISDTALFASGSAVIKEDAKKIALVIADMLEEYPGYDVLIAGHTDNNPINTPEFPSNWDLSSKRALNFMKIVLQSSSLSPERFVATGYGEYRPVEANDTAEGRAANRRVEVSILRSVQTSETEEEVAQ